MPAAHSLLQGLRQQGQQQRTPADEALSPSTFTTGQVPETAGEGSEHPPSLTLHFRLYKLQNPMVQDP